MKNWWKVLTIILLLYTVSAGFLLEAPRRFILHETIRNLYFHVPMWFSMILLFFGSVVYSVKYLSGSKLLDDAKAHELINVGLVFGILGILTGSLWAKYTWGAWWTNDVKLNGSAISILIYFAYLVLRGSMEDSQKRARVSAVYNIFAFVMLIVFIGVLPRMTDSLHPGNGGNPGFASYDLDSTMRMVFYPAVVGWALLGLWIYNIKLRTYKLKELEHEKV